MLRFNVLSRDVAVKDAGLLVFLIRRNRQFTGTVNTLIAKIGSVAAHWHHSIS